MRIRELEFDSIYPFDTFGWILVHQVLDSIFCMARMKPVKALFVSFYSTSFLVGKSTIVCVHVMTAVPEWKGSWKAVTDCRFILNGKNGVQSCC